MIPGEGPEKLQLRHLPSGSARGRAGVEVNRNGVPHPRQAEEGVLIDGQLGSSFE